jgi:hypothetical protein
VDGERAGVDVTHRVDQADHAARAAQVQPGQGLAVGGQVEERVTGQDLVAVRDQPVVELLLLGLGRVQLVPDVGTAAGRAQPGDAQLGAVLVGDGLELVELVDVLPGHHDRDLGMLEPGLGEVLQRGDRGVERARATDVVVDLGRRAVHRDLDVDVVGRGELRGPLLVELDAVGGELDADVVGDGVVQQLPEVRAHGRLATTDVDVEDLHALQLVDDGLGLGGAQLARVTPPGAGQAVHAREVARVGELPGQADGRVQAVLEVVDQLHGHLTVVVGGAGGTSGRRSCGTSAVRRGHAGRRRAGAPRRRRHGPPSGRPAGSPGRARPRPAGAS